MLSKIALLALSLSCALSAVAADNSNSAGAKEASYHLTNSFTIKIPKGAKTVRVWFAVPQEDAYTTISNFKVECSCPVKFDKDSWENKIGYLELQNPTQESVPIKEDFDLTRVEILNHLDPSQTRPLSEAERSALAMYLRPTANTVVNDKMKKLAESITGGETNPLLAARKLYDWTYKNVDFWTKDPAHHKASGIGNSEYCLASRTGNCSDIHSLFASLAICSNIPTRLVFGSMMKTSLNGTDVDLGYHCWIEFFAPRVGWLPMDVSLANIFADQITLDDKNKKLVELTTATGYRGQDLKMVDYYFDNLDDRRVVWTRGRDLIMQPPQDDGPVNLLMKAYMEVDGKQSDSWSRILTYKELGREGVVGALR